MVTNHLGEVVISLGGEEWTKNACVALLAIANTAGRIPIGYLSDHLYAFAYIVLGLGVGY